MKSLQKRIYNVLGAASTTSSPTTATRARSNSLSSSTRPFHTISVSPLNFFDSPPASSPRSSIPSSSRLPVEAKPAELEGPPHTTHGQPSQTNVSHPPLSLALTQPQSNGGSALVGNSHGSPGHPSLFSYSLSPAPNLSPTILDGACTQQQHIQAKRYKPKYQFYVGAYGIPKKCAAPSASTRRRPTPPRSQIEDDMGLAVQVGEDAYFIRDNAMGVADGVGGWAKAKPRDTRPERSHASKTTPSALFARRLMHYCSAEVENVSGKVVLTPPKVPPICTPRLPFALSSPVPRSAQTSILVPHATPWQWSDSTAPFSTPFLSSALPSRHTAVPSRLDSSRDDVSALEEDLEETLEELSEGIDVLKILERAYDRTLKAHVVPAEESVADLSRSRSPTPLASSSPSKQPLKSIDIPQSSLLGGTADFHPKGQMIPLMSGSSTALLAVLDHITKLETISKMPSVSTTNLEAEGRHDAVLRIAHVGDCMAMLIRGEGIVWRSEEMWWNFNTPVQLGPSTPTTPRTSAHLFTLPVCADDILILATDGLSDNLWDEDVLDEVVRFRRNFLGHDQEGTDNVPISSPASTAAERVLRRRTLAGMLSEALCSRARRASERSHSDPLQKGSKATGAELGTPEDDEVPFARRAREAGKVFRGGKNDDISVIVAVISPAADLAEETVSI